MPGWLSCFQSSMLGLCGYPVFDFPTARCLLGYCTQWSHQFPLANPGCSWRIELADWMPLLWMLSSQLSLRSPPCTVPIIAPLQPWACRISGQLQTLNFLFGCELLVAICPIAFFFFFCMRQRAESRKLLYEELERRARQ